MKTSLKKLRGLALHGHVEHKEKRDLRSSAKLDELAQAYHDMEDMRDCYDSLLSAAAAAANSAYEFSQSLREMGSCLLEKTSLNDDEESGKVLLMLGKVQFEIDKLMNTYRSHIFQTITIPSESLLNELRTVEEMKRQCDEKRDVYEYMRMKHREKGRSKSGKGENFSEQQIQAARDEYDEEATLFVFRLKSLRQGQSRSLVTQAARHHAAQSCFFRKALKSLESVEPHMKSVTERQHIDYKLSGLEDDHGDFCSDDDDSSYDDGELSFDYGINDREEYVISTLRKSMELDQPDLKVVKMEAAKENLNSRSRNYFAFNKEVNRGTQSAPLFAEKKFDAARNLRELCPSLSRKFHSYVLPTPTPLDTRISISSEAAIPVSHMRQTGPNFRSHGVSHSSPLNSKKFEKPLGQGKFSGTIVQNAEWVLKESNSNTESNRLPPPLAKGLLNSQLDPFAASYSNKYKRQAFSGPLSSKSWSCGPLLGNPVPQSSLPKVSASSSPTFSSSPKISELHELPRPPISSISKSPRSLGLVGYSGPLLSRSRQHSGIHKSMVSDAASLLPTPAQALSRSFSIPSSGSKATDFRASNRAEIPQDSEILENITSPPLTTV